jgi:hypothetical protein
VEVDLSQNPNSTIPFQSNSDPRKPWTNLDDGKDMLNADSNEYWYHYVIVAYQPHEGPDNDPVGEALEEGDTVNSGLRIFMSAIFLESIREIGRGD